MTQIKILKEKEKEENKKPIEVIGCVQSLPKYHSLTEDWINFNNYSLSKYEEIEVIKIGGYHNFDCIIIGEDTLYFGFFNDGFIK